MDSVHLQHNESFLKKREGWRCTATIRKMNISEKFDLEFILRNYYFLLRSKIGQAHVQTKIETITTPIFLSFKDRQTTISTKITPSQRSMTHKDYEISTTIILTYVRLCEKKK